VLREFSKMEQRYDAVVAVVRDGLTVSEVAIKFGVSRQRYGWIDRREDCPHGRDGPSSWEPSFAHNQWCRRLG